MKVNSPVVDVAKGTSLTGTQPLKRSTLLCNNFYASK